MKTSRTEWTNTSAYYSVFYFIKYSLFDSLNLHQLFHGLKSAVCFPVGNNTVSFGISDAGQCLEFLFCSRINIYLSLIVRSCYFCRLAVYNPFFQFLRRRYINALPIRYCTGLV